jgi:hypothetical protein
VCLVTARMIFLILYPRKLTLAFQTMMVKTMFYQSRKLVFWISVFEETVCLASAIDCAEPSTRELGVCRRRGTVSVTYVLLDLNFTVFDIAHPGKGPGLLGSWRRCMRIFNQHSLCFPVPDLFQCQSLAVPMQLAGDSMRLSAACLDVFVDSYHSLDEILVAEVVSRNAPSP